MDLASHPILREDHGPELLHPLLLASSSPRRTDLLQAYQYHFQQASADLEELSEHPQGGHALVKQNALLKAQHLSQQEPWQNHIVLAADTMVTLDPSQSTALGKPQDRQEAVAMLQSLVGRTHQVLSGVALSHHQSTQLASYTVATQVQFKALSTTEIEDYLDLIHPYDKAGSYAAQEHGDRIIQSIKGSWTNVVGLPMEGLAQRLKEFEKKVTTNSQ